MIKEKLDSGNSVINDNNSIRLKETDSKFTYLINLIHNTSKYNNIIVWLL